MTETDPNPFAEASGPRASLYGTTKHGIAQRRRAGIDFKARTWRKVDIIDGSDEEIAERVKKGESVANAAGAAALIADDGLLVLDTPPPEPKPIPMPARATTFAPLPLAMREFAADLNVHVPSTLAGATSILRHRITSLAQTTKDPRVAMIWRRLGELVLSGSINDEARRLRYAFVDEYPFKVEGGGVFGGDPNATPLPLIAHRWHANEPVPLAWLAIAAQLGAEFPGPFVDPCTLEREHAIDELAQAQQGPRASDFEDIAGSVRDPITGRRRFVDPISPVSSPEDPNTVAAAHIAEAERRFAEVNAKTVAAQNAWSDEREAVRRRLVYAVDAALAAEGVPSLARFSLGELARELRGLSVSVVYTADPKLFENGRTNTAEYFAELAIGVVVFEAPDVVEPTFGARTKVHVWIKPHVTTKQRRRAGFVFGREPIEVEVDEAQRALIENDDALEVVDAEKFALDRMPQSARREHEAKIARLRAEIEEVQRQNAELRGEDELKKQLAMRPPTRSSNPARVTRAPKGDVP